ncbi:cold-shock protein [Marinobacter nauticus]|uniref:cold-shock protein n=1 Tax=Marinobacter nauticus TaxID=2743 RepID=UPI003969F4C8
MNSDIAKHWELGVVKWFGGFNSKTNRENDFGFIESIRGEDIFVHKSALIDSTTLLEGGKVSFSVTQGAKGPQATEVRKFSLGNEEVLDFVNVLKGYKGRSVTATYLRYLKELEQFFYSSPDDVKSKIAKALFEDDAGRSLIGGFRDEVGVYRQVLLSTDFQDFIGQGPNLDSLPYELILENEEEICRLICEGSIPSISRDFVESATLPILYACALVDLIDEPTLHARESELRIYLRNKFADPDGEDATLYKDIFAACIERIGGYKESPIIWSILSELLLKKYIYDRNFDKAAYLYNSTAGLERKIDCFILYNLMQLLAAGNDLRTTYQVFVHLLWQGLATKQVNVEEQAGRVLSLFSSCGTMKLAIPDKFFVEQEDDDPLGLDTASYMKQHNTGIVSRVIENRNLSCEAVYWKKQNKYLCRGSVCSNPKISPNLNRSYLDFSIYDWFSHLGVEFSVSEDHQIRDFPIKLAGYLNRLREIMPRLRCRSCSELMVPDFKYSRVKCSVYENGQWVQKDMAAAYRNTVFYCNNESCHEHSIKYYINHCLGNLCFEVIDSRDLTMKCDAGRFICKGCASCCGEHAKSNPVGFCPECGGRLQLFEDRGQVSRFGRYMRFVRCSNHHCGFTISEPGLPKRFYLDSCQPVHQLEAYL